MNEIPQNESCVLVTKQFRRLTTSFSVAFQMILLIILQVFVLLLLINHENFVEISHALYTILLCQATYWLISMILNSYYKSRHKFLRLDGYFEFYKRTKNIINRIFLFSSLSNALMLVSLAIYSEKSHFLSLYPINFNMLIIILCIIVTIEVLATFIILFRYLVSVKEFNKLQPESDVYRITMSLPNSNSLGEIGFRDHAEDIVDLLEKQADLINYYKKKNDYLLQRIRNSCTSDSPLLNISMGDR